MADSGSAAPPKRDGASDLVYPIDLATLVNHRTTVEANQTLGEVFQVFAESGFDYVGVVEGEVLLGLCAKRDVGMLLGSKYGFSLFAPTKVKEHLVDHPITIKLDAPLPEVFAAVFSREGESFFDDVLLVGQDGELIGLIETQSLVTLQNSINLKSIRLLESQAREIRLKNEQIEADLRLCRELQQSLLPGADYLPRGPAVGIAFNIHHCYRPVGMVGGDFFHIRKIGESAAGIFIADVMGHGVRAAIITAMLRAMLEAIEEEAYRNPARLLDHINRELAKLLRLSGSDVIYASALYVFADAESRSFRFANAGHPLPIHIRGKEGRVDMLAHPNPGTVLGIFDEEVYSNHVLAYEAGDSLIVYTDGIIEVENAMGKEFGSSRLCEILIESMGRPMNQVLDGLILRVGNFAGNGQFCDDICVVGVELG